jgi:hypothetical protein
MFVVEPSQIVCSQPHQQIFYSGGNDNGDLIGQKLGIFWLLFKGQGNFWVRKWFVVST